jgi:predicted RNase H-like HicB family nuclease
MKRYTYAAICERGESGFGAYFPDLPGCVTAADSLSELAEMAREALQLHLEGVIADGDTPPEPTPIDRLPHDPQIAEAGVILVTATPGADEILLSLPETVLSQVDATAQSQGRTRAEVLTEQIEQLFPAK